MTRYVRSLHLEVEQHVGEEVVFAHGLVGTRLRLNSASQKLLSAFARPRALEDLVGPASIEKVRPTFDLLRARSFLVEEGRNENIGDRRLERLARGIFGCPQPAHAAAVPDYTFLGVPFDHGNHGEPGARFGPGAVRDAAVELHLQDTPDPATGRSAGWHNNDTDSAVLAGAALADEGNVYVAPGEAPGRVFEKVRSVVADIRGRGSFPVVLGGDHSISYPVLSAYDEPLAVFHLDAHSDMAPYHPGIENHHGNVMSRALGLPHVRAIYQVGLRGTTPVSQLRTDQRRPLVASPARMRALGVAGVLERIPATHPLYVSVDIDVLDPAGAPGTSTPVPGGLGFEEVRDLLRALGAGRRCIGFDIVEVNPRRDVNRVTAHAALELTLAFLGAHFERGRRSHD